MFFGHRKDKGFSSGNKVQQYHGNGLESIVLMGKPFRVLQKLSDTPAPYMTSRPSHSEDKDKGRFVYLVENSCRLSEFPRHMALKRCVFNVDQVGDAHREIDILSRIKDKNICRVFHSEVSRSEGRLGVSIAMEYCSNNLYRRIRSGMGSGAGTRLSESEICHALLAITSAVGYLHSQQPPIAHRDIRPENILINNKASGPAQFKLTNFSSATTDAYHCETREEASMAIADIEVNTNPGFRSPEMADPWSRKRICEKSDMWSIGVLLYYMMYLKLPFEPTNMALVNNPKVRYPESELSRYTGSLRVVVDHLLEPDPEKRWDVFALTNFLRFDEDVSRHLGTFIFTRTEWPEGWEEQDVKVIGREVPPKAPPVTYNDDLVHETTQDIKKMAEANRPKSGAASSAPAASSHARGDAVSEAMMVLGGEDDDDPEMAKYREMIIKEQQEALNQIKAASGRPPSPPSSNTNNNTAPAAPAPKKDVFDDLFAAPEPTPAQQPPASNNTNTNFGQNAAPVNNNNTAPAPKADLFSADDLFGGTPAPVNNNNNNYNNNNYGNNNFGNNNFSPAPMNTYNDNNNNNFGNQGGWSTGLPQQQPPPPQQQGGWNNNSYNNNNNAPMDFTAPGPGQINHNNNTQPQNNNNNNNNNASQQTKRKDPFADLFS